MNKIEININQQLGKMRMPMFRFSLPFSSIPWIAVILVLGLAILQQPSTLDAFSGIYFDNGMFL